MLKTVLTKATKNRPAIATEYQAEIVKNESIRIVRDITNGKRFENTFKLGEFAEYDSYNLSYYGPIIAITDKTVTIISRFDLPKHEQGEKVKKHRLDLYKFAWRNYNFDLNATSKENSETSYYI